MNSKISGFSPPNENGNDAHHQENGCTEQGVRLCKRSHTAKKRKGKGWIKQNVS